MSKPPMQPLCRDPSGVIRFQENAVVRHVLRAATEAGATNLNRIAAMVSFSDEDRQQFAQLIGYSVSGYGDLCDDHLDAAAAAVEAQVAFERAEMKR